MRPPAGTDPGAATDSAAGIAVAVVADADAVATGTYLINLTVYLHKQMSERMIPPRCENESTCSAGS
jgi:hypothetical protein